jgi:hypothetical protein
MNDAAPEIRPEKYAENPPDLGDYQGQQQGGNRISG